MSFCFIFCSLKPLFQTKYLVFLVSFGLAFFHFLLSLYHGSCHTGHYESLDTVTFHHFAVHSQDALSRQGSQSQAPHRDQLHSRRLVHRSTRLHGLEESEQVSAGYPCPDEQEPQGAVIVSAFRGEQFALVQVGLIQEVDRNEVPDLSHPACLLRQRLRNLGHGREVRLGALPLKGRQGRRCVLLLFPLLLLLGKTRFHDTGKVVQDRKRACVP